MTEQELGLTAADVSFSDRYERYHRALSERLLGGSPEAVTPLMRMGDFIVWSSLTPHFTLPSFPFPTQRLSLQVLIRPTSYRWGDFTVQPAEHPVYRAMRMTERFSFYVSEQISRDFGISESTIQQSSALGGSTMEPSCRDVLMLIETTQESH